MDPATYFGIPGQTRKLFDPAGGIVATRDVGTSVFVTGSAGARVDKAYGGNRTYVLNYGALGRENFDWLNNFQQGHMGPGPFVLLDPGRRNLLTVNQSAGTSASNDTREFTVSGVGGSISSDPTLVTPFPKVLKWSFATSTPGALSLTLDKPSRVTTWYGIPVVQRPYCFWMYVIGGPITLQVNVQWYGLAGNLVLDQYSSNFVTSATNWSRPILQGATPPVGAYWALCRVVPDQSTIAAGEALYMSSFMFHEGDNPETWSGGTGVYPVQTMGMPERYGFAEPGMLVSPALTLQEVR
jgi:hypothetical protein